MAQIQMKSRLLNWINAESYSCLKLLSENCVSDTDKFELQSHMPATLQCIHSGSHSKKKVLYIFVVHSVQLLG